MNGRRPLPDESADDQLQGGLAHMEVEDVATVVDVVIHEVVGIGAVISPGWESR
jgi:hypothetical protein